MIYLVRHGQTDWNIVHRIQGHLDIPLNETGREQTEICGELLADVKLDQIISSDLSRARETADIINKRFHLPVVPDARLRELAFGDLQGVLVQDVTDALWDTFNHEAHKLHAEALPDVYKRVKSLFDEIDATKNTLVVTHGGVFRMVMYLSQYPNSFNQTEFERTCLQFKIKNTDIFVWDKLSPMHRMTEE